jgi:hypothetical protein
LDGASACPLIGTSSMLIDALTWCGGSGKAASTKCCARLHADSVTAQNKDGLSTHPIRTADGTTILHGSPSCWGSTYAKLKQSASRTISHQNPLLMSSLDIRMWRPAGVSCIYVRSRGSTFPILRTASFGARIAVVMLTLSCVAVMTPSTSWYTGKDKSRMIQGRRRTCGTAATGEILRFNGRSRCRSFHRMTLQNPASRWYSMLSLNRAIASAVQAVGWGP